MVNKLTLATLYLSAFALAHPSNIRRQDDGAPAVPEEGAPPAEGAPEGAPPAEGAPEEGAPEEGAPPAEGAPEEGMLRSTLATLRSRANSGYRRSSR